MRRRKDTSDDAGGSSDGGKDEGGNKSDSGMEFDCKKCGTKITIKVRRQLGCVDKSLDATLSFPLD